MYNQKFQKSLKKLTSKLISTLTDFNEGTENYDSCMEFSLSNFLHHRYLEADSHKIGRQFTALSEKFFIHSQPEKAKLLQKLFTYFVSNNISETSYSKSQVHYSLLNIILNLSDRPINASYSQTKSKAKNKKQDNTDWRAYLLEGEDNPKLWGWGDSPISSDDEDVSFDLEQVPTKTTQNDECHPSHVPLPVFKQLKSDKCVKLVESYWKHKVSDLDRQAIHSGLCKVQSQPTNTRATFLTEWHLLRETIWLLSGRDNLHVYPDENASEKLLLSHQTEKSVQENIATFGECGKHISKLRSFVFSSKSHESLTYEAFSFGLLAYFKWLETDLMTLEKLVVKLEDTFLLDDLKEQLMHQLNILNTISNVYDSSIGGDTSDDTTAVRACRLLGAISSALLDEWNQQILDGSDKVNSVDVLLFLWLETIQPYINVIDGWISIGELVDPKQEFVLQRQLNVPNCQDVQFWNKAVSKVVVNVKEQLPWLHQLLEKVITGGKSMEIVKTLLIQPSKNNFAPNAGKAKTKLYSIFKTNFLAMLGNVAVSQSDFKEGKKSTAKQKGDILLQTNFKILCDQEDFTEPVVANLSKLCRSEIPLPVLIQRSLYPLVDEKCRLACRSLLDVFQSHFGLASSLEVFHNFHLMGWGDVLHEFCTNIFQDIANYGNISQDLVGLNILLQEAIAQKSSTPVDVYVTHKSLKNKLPDRQGLLGEKICKKQPQRHSITLTDDLHIAYDVVWPVALILSEESIETYQRIFSYLMQIKRAVHSVECLKFETIFEKNGPDTCQGDMPVSLKSHRLAVLRAKILHLLKHWHSFIMVSVIQAEKATFTDQLQNAQNLDDIIHAHSEFLKRVSSLCLLEKRNQAEKLVHGTLVKIMTQAIAFGMIWERGVQNISGKLLLKKESDFNECSEFLGRILKTISSRGSMPVLDSLAYSVLPP